MRLFLPALITDDINVYFFLNAVKRSVYNDELYETWDYRTKGISKSPSTRVCISDLVYIDIHLFVFVSSF